MKTKIEIKEKDSKKYNMSYKDIALFPGIYEPKLCPEVKIVISNCLKLYVCEDIVQNLVVNNWKREKFRKIEGKITISFENE